MSHSLSLIKELTEENERLREDNEIKSQKRANIFEITNAFERGRTDGVRKYKSAIIEYYSKPKYQPTKEHPIKHTQIEHLLAVLAEKEKELLEAKP